jgi:hypothetical protein
MDVFRLDRLRSVETRTPCDDQASAWLSEVKLCCCLGQRGFGSTPLVRRHLYAAGLHQRQSFKVDA